MATKKYLFSKRQIEKTYIKIIEKKNDLQLDKSHASRRTWMRIQKNTHTNRKIHPHTHAAEKKIMKKLPKKKMKNEMWGDNLFTQCINTKQIFFLREIQWPQWAFSIYLRFQLRTLTHTQSSPFMHITYKIYVDFFCWSNRNKNNELVLN